jgi:hypothetical protein
MVGKSISDPPPDENCAPLATNVTEPLVFQRVLSATTGFFE